MGVRHNDAQLVEFEFGGWKRRGVASRNESYHFGYKCFGPGEKRFIGRRIRAVFAAGVKMDLQREGSHEGGVPDEENEEWQVERD